jgi:hypothetical protein
MRLIVLLASGSMLGAFGQANWHDANDFAEAALLMRTHVAIASTMRNICVTRFPQNAKSYDSSFQHWQTTNRGLIELAMKNSRDVDTNPQLKNSIYGIASAMEEKAKTVGNASLVYSCNLYFDELDRGVWRSRTPRMYQFLEARQGKRQ